MPDAKYAEIRRMAEVALRESAGVDLVADWQAAALSVYRTVLDAPHVAETPKQEHDAGDIVEYCTVTEQPDLDAAEQLLRDNGYTITPPAKPLTFEDVEPLTDALIDPIESAARASFQRHQRSVRGQTVTHADNYDWHLLHATYQASIDTMRAQLAEAKKDAERYRWLRDGVIVGGEINEGLYGHIDHPSHPNRWALAGPELDEAIDAARAQQEAG